MVMLAAAMLGTTTMGAAPDGTSQGVTKQDGPAQNTVIDPVTTEYSPRRLLPLEGRYADDARAQVRSELCPAAEPCAYAFGEAEEIAGSMCWNDEALGQALCRDAVAGLRVNMCHTGPDGSKFDCWYYEIMEGEISAALAGGPRLAGRDITWVSRERADTILYDIKNSPYCATPAEGACTRLYNVGVTYNASGRLESYVFEHCWDDAEAGLARCRQAIIGVPGAG